MKVSIVIDEKGLESGEHIIISEPKELRLIIEVFESFCKANPKQKKARALLLEMNHKFQCY